MSNQYFLDLMTMEEQAQTIRLSTVSELEELCLKRYSEEPAINTPDMELNYRELWQRVGQFRGFLAKAGIEPGEKIAIALINSEECIEVFLAIITYGAVAVMISGSAPAVAKAQACKIAGCRYAFCIDKLPNITCWDPAEILLPDPIPAAKLEPCEAAAAFFTGGTSGKLKCAVLSNRALMTGSYFGNLFPSPVFRQKHYGLIPFSHIFGGVRSMLSCFQSGGCIRPCPDMSYLVRDLKEYKPTILELVPALAEKLLVLVKLYGPEVLGGELKQIIIGGAAYSTEMVRFYKEELGINVICGYGMTETAHLVCGNEDLLLHENSVGQLYGFQDIRFVNGEIQLRGDNVFMHYINDPEETRSAFDGEWFRTGDLGYMDEDGYIYITGRLKNLIYLPNGEKISPEQIEERVDQISGVTASKVCLKKNDFGAEVLTCEIYVQNGSEEAEAGIRRGIEAMNDTLEKFFRISQVLFRYEDFARTETMKIRR